MSLIVGCIEDHEPDLILIEAALRSGPVHVDPLLHAHDLRGLEQMVADNEVDVLVLDLGLPDSRGTDTVTRARELVASVPIVVLTGEEQNGLSAIAAGADDFLSKDLIGGGQLARVVAFAVERRRLRERLEDAEHENEIHRIEHGTGARHSVVASRILGDSPLAETAPEFHAEATSSFVDVVRSRLVRNAMGEAHDADQTIRLLGERLAARNAGPDDIVRILTSSVGRQRQQLAPSQFGPFVREARLALIELMGFVLANYRRHAAIGTGRRADDADAEHPPDAHPAPDSDRPAAGSVRPDDFEETPIMIEDPVEFPSHSGTRR